MDRSPYYTHPRGSTGNRASGSTTREEHDARRERDSERLPPLLPHSHHPIARSDPLAPPPASGSRLPPINPSAAANATSPYASHRSYAPAPDHSTAFDLARRTSPPSSLPVGMVSADYMHSRRSPGERPAPYPSSSSSSSSAYRPSHMYPHHHHPPPQPDPYHQDALRAHPSSHAPHHRLFHDQLPAPPPTLGHAPPDLDHISASTPVKRPRVSLACLACRNRKSRCDGVRPTCKTCANMKIECKWPEVDFRRAKTGDAAKARRKTPPGASTQRSPVSVDLKHHSRLDASVSDDNAYRRTSDGALPASQSMPTASFAPAALPVSDSQVSSPKSNRGYRYRTHSDGDRQARHAEAPVHAARSPTERFAYPGPQERRADPYARAEAYARPYSSTGMPDARQDVPMLDDRAQPYPQEHRAPVWEDRTSRPIRALPELRPPQRDPAAIRCRNRAAQIAVLARPATDSERIAVEAHLSTESNLEDLADQATAGERLDHAFATDWDAIGGLAPAARRPFMDVAAGLVGVLEISDMDAQRGHARVSAESVGRLHLFRLRHGSTDAVPDLRHLNIAMDLPLAERRELLETTSSPYNTLSYPIPVDRLSRPLVEVMRRGHHEKQEEQQVKHGRASNVGTGAALRSFPPPSDSIPIVRKEDIKPPQAIQELFLQAYIRAIGEQMPGLNTNVVAARIRDGSISALLANALCAIGASLYERRGQRPSIGEALSSKVYVERARALLGAAIQNPDIEAILALGVMAIRDILLGQTISAAVIVSSAVRLCMQLDLHRSRAKKPPSTQEGDDAVTKLKADDMFWMIYCLDRITSIATARPLAIKDRDIDTPFPATMRNNEPCIFAALVRQLHYLGRLVDIAVSGAGTNADRTRDLELAAIAADLNAHYTSLPATLLLSKTNLNLAQDRGEPLSYLQLHLTHHLALLHRFLLSRGGMTSGEHDAMRAAAAAVVQICKMGEEVNATLLADTPLSAAACFLAGCVQLAEIEAGDDEAAQSALECVMTTLSRHAEFWPVAGGLADVLHAERSRFRTQLLSAKALGKIVSQVEAVHVVVRRPSEELDGQQAVKVVKVDDLDVVRGAFPHLC